MKKPLQVLLWTVFNVGTIVAVSHFALNLLDITNWITWLIAGTCCLVISLSVTLISALIFYKKKLLELKNTFISILGKIFKQLKFRNEDVL